jgi:membrane fusion protein (multidrug efflux system)
MATVKRSGVAALAIVLAAAAMPLAAVAQQGQPAAVPVGTVSVKASDITKTLEFVGRVEAVNRVEVRARVTGYLEEVLFKEGDLINEGNPLYRIQKEQYQAAVEQAQGELEGARGAKTLSQIQLDRAQELLDKQSGTAVARDQAKAADQQADGTVMKDEANLKNAQLNLSYTDITSPITGKIGRTNITKGNVVSPDSGVLTMIVSQDPMYITFPVSQRDLLHARESALTLDDIKITLRFADGSSYDQTGHVNFLNVTVDRTTDTVLARANMPNPKGSLIDGQLVRVIAELGAPEQKLVIPQAALLADQQGVYVFIVEDGKAAIRRVKPGQPSGADVVITDGLSAGELVVVQGLQGIRPGLPVRATPLTVGINPS